MPRNYRKLRVLVADDFSSFRNTVNGMLTALGVEKIDMASSGEEVIEKCRDNTYDLILSDYDLGHGRNGQHVLEELRHRALIDWRTLYMIVSAEASRYIVMAAYDCEPDDYLMKPISAQMIERRMSRLLDRQNKLKPAYKKLANQDTHGAIEYLTDLSIAEDRHSTAAQKLLGELFLKQGEYKKAEKLYTKALEVRQLDWARLGLAKVKQKLGELDTAEKWLGQIVEENPLFLPAYDTLADNWDEKGETDQTQKVMEQAIEISPIAILRQKRLATIAQVNADEQAAVEALRKAVKLGRLSCYGAAEDSVNFAQLVLHSEKIERSKSLVKEAYEFMVEASKKYDMNDDERAAFNETFSQISILETGKAIEIEPQGASAEEFSEPFTENEMDIDVSADSVSDMNEEFEANTTDIHQDIQQVIQFLKVGDKNAADNLLEQLKIKYADNEDALEKLDQFLDEPVSEVNRSMVSQINREGISLYGDGEFDDALECFEKARRLFPNHIGIQLNIAQSLLGKLKNDPQNSTFYSECNQALDLVDELINEDHAHFERYDKLRRLVAVTVSEHFDVNGENHA